MKFKKPLSGVIIAVVALATIAGLSGLNFLIPIGTRIDPHTKDFGVGVGTDEKGIDADNERINQLQSISMEKIFLSTGDNVKIVGNLYKASNPRGWIIFLHMMPAQKESWDDLAKEFQDLGYESLAIDFRGHGESTRTDADLTRTDAEILDYRNFSDEEQQKKILDVETAVNYLLENQGARLEQVFLIGASIGANLSLEYLNQHPEVKKAVLLSAGLNYRGVKTGSFIKNLKPGQQAFFVSSRDDGNNSNENQILYDAVPAGAEKKIQIYDTAGHGTTMLEREPELKKLIVAFITK